MVFAKDLVCAFDAETNGIVLNPLTYFVLAKIEIRGLSPNIRGVIVLAYHNSKFKK